MSVDYTAILCYGYKLTPEEVAKIGVERLHDIKAECEMEPHPYGLICDDDYSNDATWYVGRWMESSSADYESGDFALIEERDMSSIDLLLNSIFGENYDVKRTGAKTHPSWHLFTRCW